MFIFTVAVIQSAANVNVQSVSISQLLIVKLSSSWQDFSWKRASWGPSAIAGLLVQLVFICRVTPCWVQSSKRPLPNRNGNITFMAVATKCLPLAKPSRLQKQSNVILLRSTLTPSRCAAKVVPPF